MHLLETSWQAWTQASIRPLTAENRHGLHTYFTTSPESPDGRWVVFFSSQSPDGQVGDVCVMDRVDGGVRVLATDIVTEDAHRQAYQQWSCGGRAVVFQDGRDGAWTIRSVAMATGETRTLARGRQLGFGSPTSKFVPIHGLHWNPGPYRDIELIDVESGTITTAAAASQLLDEMPGWIDQQLGGRDISLFFGVCNGDTSRMIFKVSRPLDGQYRSPDASRRVGMIGFDLRARSISFVRENWGHPAWHADGRRIITTPNVVIDAGNGRESALEGMTHHPGAHPAFHPSGSLVVTDTVTLDEGGQRWSVLLLDPTSGREHVLHAAPEAAAGAASWRPAHPHPVFNRAGNRLYFNVNCGAWSRLWVGEVDAR